MDPGAYNMMIAQLLYGGPAPYGTPSTATTWPMPQQPSSSGMGQTGQSPGAGMLGSPPPNGTNASLQASMNANAMPSSSTSPSGPMNPNMPQMSQTPQMPQTPPAQGSMEDFRTRMLPYTQNAYPAGQNPFQAAGNQQMMQPFAAYPGMSTPDYGMDHADGGGR